MELRNNKVDKQADEVATGYFTDEYMGWWASNFTAGYISTAKLIVDGVVKDRWTELKRFVALLKDGGNVNVWYHYDLTKIPETSGEIAIEKPTVIDFKKAVTLTVGKSQIINKSQLTIRGEGTMTATANIITNEGKVTIDGGNFQATARRRRDRIQHGRRGNQRRCTGIQRPLRHPEQLRKKRYDQRRLHYIERRQRLLPADAWFRRSDRYERYTYRQLRLRAPA